MIRIRRVLVATDFGEAAQSALRYGREFARQFDADLHLLHVTENIHMSVAVGYGYANVPADLQQSIERSAQERTQGLLTDEDRRTLRVTAATATGHSPAAAIVEYARSHDVDLIVVGTHGRGPLAHMIMGSVAERVVRLAPCPVLTVHSPEHEFVTDGHDGPSQST